MEHCLTPSNGKIHDKKIGGNGGGGAKLGQKFGFLHFLKVASLVFLDIAQDCCLGQCLISSRAETSKKKNPFDSNRDERPLKLACFLYHKLILFSQKNYKKQAQMFYQNHSLALYTVEIFCNSIYHTGLGLTLEYNGLELEKYLNYLTELGLILVQPRRQAV